MLQEHVRNVRARRCNGLTTNFPMGDGKGLGGLNLNHRPENRSQALEVVNSHLGQRTYAAVVIPPRPGGTGVAIEAAGRVHFANRALPVSVPKGLEMSARVARKARTSDADRAPAPAAPVVEPRSGSLPPASLQRRACPAPVPSVPAWNGFPEE